MRQSYWTILLNSALMVFLMHSSALSAVPNYMNYQGRLTNGAGNPIDTTVNIMFTIYDEYVGGTMLWGGTYSVTVTNGMFSQMLGPFNTPLVVFDGSMRYLSIKVGTGPEGNPRTPILTVAYAHRSDFADTAAYAISASGGGWVDDGADVHLETSGDNVGIGTATPSEKLDVDGNVRVGGTLSIGDKFLFEPATNKITSTSDFFNFDSAAIQTSGYLAVGGPRYSNKRLTVETVGLKDTAAILAFNTTGTAAIFRSGTSGSGYPAVPAAVSGTGGGTSNGGSFTASGDGHALTAQANGVGHAIHGNAAGTGYSGFFQGGLGVKVNGDLEVTGSFKLPDGAAVGRVLTSDASGVASWQASSGGSPWTSNGSSVYLNNSGLNVGIGTSSPSSKLVVDGNIWSTGVGAFGGPIFERKSIAAYASGTADSFAVWGTNSNGTAAGFYSGTNANVAPGTPTAVFARAGGEAMAGSFGSMGNGVGLYVYSAGSRDALQVNTAGTSYAGRFTGGLGVRVNGDLLVTGTTAGDGAADLPDNSISSAEILDEPGIAANFNASDLTNLTTGSMIDISVVTITTPTAGYILIEGRCIIIFRGTTSGNYVDLQIDETSGGTGGGAAIGYQGYPSTSAIQQYAAANNVYYKPAGTYTFRLEGRRTTSFSGEADAAGAGITATFFPSSYGSISKSVGGDEVGNFDNAIPVSASVNQPGSAENQQQLYQVDLRELELRAARARADAEKAERELLEARLREQEATVHEEDAKK